ATVDALADGDIARVGELMNASHASLRDDFQVSCYELDEMADVCRAGSDVLGSRMMGGGFGGCTISICTEHADIDAITHEILAEFKRRTGIDAKAFGCRPVDRASEIL